MKRPWAALVLLCLAQFMLIIDITVVQVALPTIGTDLGLGREALTWVVTTYTLCFGGLMVLGGRLSDAFGARRMLVTGLAVFTAASLVCGLAGSGTLLIVGRGLQGVGAALLSPAALATITTSFHGRERTRALSVWAAIGGTGAALGVLLGGLLTAGPGWSWVFFVNVPVGLLVMLALPRFVPSTPNVHAHVDTTPSLAHSQASAKHAEDATARTGHASAGTAREDATARTGHGHAGGVHGSRAAGRRGLDVPGAVAVTAATALLIYGLVAAGDAGWASVATVSSLAGSALLYVVFVLIERASKAPLMNAATLARRPVISGTFVILVATGLLFGLFFASSMYLQHVLRFSPLETGLLFLPVAIAITLGAQVGGHLIGRIGGRPVAVGAFVLVAVGAGLMTRIAPDSNAYLTLLPGFLIAAFGVGPAFVTATTTTMANVPADEAGVASGVVNTFHELGGSIGVAVVSTLAAASLAPGAVGVDGFTTALTACAIVAGVTAAISLALVPGGKPAAAFVGHGHGH